PVDPETFRDTYQPYTPYVQIVGRNPFNFFDPAMGARVSIGDALRGINLQLFAGPGYTRESELAVTGVDTELYAQEAMGPFTLSAWRYAGSRPIPGSFDDRFERVGYGFTYGQWSRFSSETVYINGWDSNCAAPRLTGCTSTGGFEQLRQELSRNVFAEARYEWTQTPPAGLSHDGVLLLGYGPTENMRITVENVFAASPPNTMNAQFTIAY
ncbi:MAG: hypothetical protein JO113_04405, partial [Candidatus Eremiobacteraeota bacterium]|nr:hypothetical protein [Candidatus Eremiobacteraeota bacterium]